jgi:uncharacterized protein involved in exopolysaccharide biosynthesis
MTEASPNRKPPNLDDEVSILTAGIVLLKWRRTILGVAVVGGVLGLTIGLTSTRMYESSAVFIPQEASEANLSGLAAAASQFGVRIPSSGGGTWGVPVYVELLQSPALLEPIAMDTIAVAEQGGKRAALMDLLKIRDPNPAMRRDLAIQALTKVITATEIRPLSAVKVSVITPWPSVSHQLAQRLLNGINRFILEKRKSQAVAERQFVEAQVRDAEGTLRAAEDRLQLFLQQNRSINGSPELTFQHDRLQRAVTVQQQTYSTWLQAREEARIREVRDTPVITVIEDPRLPTVGNPRNSIQKGILGILAGGILGVIIALLSDRLARVRSEPNETAQQFFALAHDMMPRRVRRGTQ